ncbi:MAG: calcium-binding protein [Synechococcales cyanobacterium CRU_2_2]|nr:calcium-binding protein [Synechococcales cyanobacterium CRU_2_2]
MSIFLTANGLPTTLPALHTFFTLDIEPETLKIDPEALSPSLPDALRSNATFYAVIDFATSATELTNKLPTPARFNLIFGTSRGDYLIGSSQADVMFGFGGSDTMYGGGGSDRLSGGQGIDILNGEAGNDLLYGGSGNDVLDGGAGNDRLFGASGDDVLWGSRGDDVLDGGVGRDIANYSELTQAITLEAIGKITKSGQGNDQLKSIEVIIGAQNQRNKIDASMVTLSGTYLDVDLGIDSVNVKGIPGLGGQAFVVQNFREVVGSYGDDRIQGNNSANQFNGFAGKDTLIGGSGNDTLIANEGETLTGGAGADQFKFIAASVVDSGAGGVQSRAIEANIVRDFEVGRDRLVFENSPGAVGSVYAIDGGRTRNYIPFRDLTAGALPTNQFVVLGSSRAPDNAKFIYDGSSGDLFYQGLENLPGSAQSVKIATLQGAPRISASDFLIV